MPKLTIAICVVIAALHVCPMANGFFYKTISIQKDFPFVSTDGAVAVTQPIFTKTFAFEPFFKKTFTIGAVTPAATQTYVQSQPVVASAPVSQPVYTQTYAAVPVATQTYASAPVYRSAPVSQPAYTRSYAAAPVATQTYSSAPVYTKTYAKTYATQPVYTKTYASAPVTQTYVVAPVATQTYASAPVARSYGPVQSTNYASQASTVAIIKPLFEKSFTASVFGSPVFAKTISFG